MASNTRHHFLLIEVTVRLGWSLLSYWLEALRYKTLMRFIVILELHNDTIVIFQAVFLS